MEYRKIVENRLMVVQMKWKKPLQLAVPIILGLILFAAVVEILLNTSLDDDWMCFKGSPERTSSNDVAAPDTVFLE